MQFIEKGFHTDKLLFIVTTEQNEIIKKKLEMKKN